jgi:hypothetical protein
MSRSGYPRNVIIRYADAFTDAPSSVTVDTHLRVDGRWNAATVRRQMMQAAAATNTRLARDRYAHPVYAMGYETKGADGWQMHPMPYVTDHQFTGSVEVATDRPGVVTEALVIRSRGFSAHALGARVEVFHGGELAGWVVQMVPVVERRVTVGWTVWWRPNNGQPDQFPAGPYPVGGKAHGFDEAVRAIVRRYRGWA